MKINITKKVFIDPSIYEQFKKICLQKGIKLQVRIGQLIEQDVSSFSMNNPGTPSPFNSPKESHSGSELDHRGEGVPFDSTLFRGEHTSL